MSDRVNYGLTHGENPLVCPVCGENVKGQHPFTCPKGHWFAKPMQFKEWLRRRIMANNS